jgi:IclR family transcriptional regulator, acetate operon repressor
VTTIRSVARASRILVQLGEQPDGRTAKEVAVALELPLPTTYHLLGTLVAEGFVAKDSRRRYRLGPALGAIADAYVRQFNPPEYLIGPLHRLADETGETVYVVTWRHDGIVVLASVEGVSAVRVSGANLGYVESAHARASGKLLLALAPEEVRAGYLALHPLDPVTPRTIVQPDEFQLELERIRLRGYAVDEEEFREGVSCIAAPVNGSGRAVTAYSLSAPTERFGRRRTELIECVLAATRRAAEAGGHDGRPRESTASLSPS